jgi:hypothetical protein
MTLQTGEGVVRALYGGYSPKLYDGGFVNIQRRDWEARLLGSTIIADEHFRKAGQSFHDVTWVTPYKERTIEDPQNRGQCLGQRTWNSHTADIRSRVEGPFGHVKEMFDWLSKPWAEEKSQQDHLVWLAVGIHNKQKL